MAATMTIDEFMELVASDDWLQTTEYEITGDWRMPLDDETGDIGFIEGKATAKSKLGSVYIFYTEKYQHDETHELEPEPMATLQHEPDDEQTWFINCYVIGDDDMPMDDDELGRLLPPWFSDIDWRHVVYQGNDPEEMAEMITEDDDMEIKS